MKIPKIKGKIDRRILINYQVDKNVLENYLPFSIDSCYFDIRS